MSKVIGETRSVCPVCLRTIPAQKIVGEDGCIYIEKSRPAHGHWLTLIWEGDAASYAAWAARDQHTPSTLPFAKASEKGCPNDCGLCTNHRQATCCTLLELTQRCNLACPVCFASSAGESGGVSRDLSLEEIARQYDHLMAHGGPYNIQLSGGEPTLRDDLAEIIALGRERGFTFFQLNTNGLRLAEEKGYAEHLAQAGVSTVFLQFDGLDDAIYRVLRGRALTATKLAAIENCKRAGLPLVLVPTLARGVNDQALGEILQFALAQAPYVRGVHIQPMSFFGRNSLDPETARLTIPAVLRLIEAQTHGLMKASDFSGGGAENPYCSFHASYIRSASGITALPKRAGSSCCQSSETRDTVARGWSAKASCCEAAPPQDACCCGGASADDSDTASLDVFLQQIVENTFTVSGMVFQDAWNLDLERLQRCYICEVDSAYGMVPFCAYNLTNIDGKALYRR